MKNEKPRFKNLFLILSISTICSFLFYHCNTSDKENANLIINDSSYFETRGLNILVFGNWYNGLFSDEKMSGIQIIHHGIRTATNGDVRLNPTPEQWDQFPQFIKRNVDIERNTIEAYLTYPKFNFNYMIKTEARDGGLYISVNLEKQLPAELEGLAGFNFEFLPAAYFGKTFLMDNNTGLFPLYPNGPMEITKSGIIEPLPISKGSTLVLAPEDPTKQVTIKNTNGELQLFDGRNKAQNGWYVVRSLIPSKKTGKVIEWFVKANTISDWIREPVITYSQLGYHPNQNKIAVIELDKNDTPLLKARLLKIDKDGKSIEIFNANTSVWGKYLRYNYLTFDFSSVKETGIYVLEYGKIRTTPFQISTQIYENAWTPTLDVYFPVAMDHMFVKEAYRVWHGKSHLDDALQAPVNHEHFDLYKQGPTTDTKYKSGEHIPGLNIGGWYDAGDFDIRTQTQYAVVLSMAQTWEMFQLKRDETTINQKDQYVNMHTPDGVPDLLQQIEHGSLQLLAQHKAVGHALNGIIEAHLSQYTHLGDAVNKTDNLIYTPKLDSLQSDGFKSGTFDDRWAFTNKSTSLNYGSIAALAATSRVLKNYNKKLAAECLATAKKVWMEEHTHKPDIFYFGNTTGGPLILEEMRAALELLICTKDSQYAEKINELLPSMEKQFSLFASVAAIAVPYMEESFKKKLEPLVKAYKEKQDSLYNSNPYGVIISTGGWAGNGRVINTSVTNYLLYKAFPHILHPEDVFKGLNYIYGCHPGSNISFVSGIGTNSKMVAYGNNRADYSFIAGGIVPGVLIIHPDFPENKEDWPFLWGENEYVVNLGASYIFLVNAVNDLLKNTK